MRSTRRRTGAGALLVVTLALAAATPATPARALPGPYCTGVHPPPPVQTGGRWPAIATLRDAFDDGEDLSSDGGYYYPQPFDLDAPFAPFVRGNELHLPTPDREGVYPDVESQGSFTLRGSVLVFRLVPPSGGTRSEVSIALVSQAERPVEGKDLRWTISVDQRRIGARVVGYYPGDGPYEESDRTARYAPYVAAQMRWFRIRERDGTTTWDHSSDGRRWRTLRSSPTPPFAGYVKLVAGTAGIAAGATDARLAQLGLPPWRCD